MNRLDLNLLLIFESVYREGSLTRAGRQLGLSQPAVSAALARLRDVVGDPLFVRTNRGVSPTERARQLAEPLDSALATIRQTLQVHSTFDPVKSDRCFRLLMPDVGGLNILPRLLEHIAALGSSISIAAIQIISEDQLNLLEKGEADLAIGFWPQLSEERGYSRRLLFVDSYTCLVRAGHPKLGKRVSLARLLEQPQIVVTRREDGAGPLEPLLARVGGRIKTAVRIPHYLSVPMILERTDLVAILPARPAAIFARDQRFRIVTTDFKLPSLEVCLFWHKRFEKDPGRAWLRDVMQDLFTESNKPVRRSLTRKARFGARFRS